MDKNSIATACVANSTSFIQKRRKSMGKRRFIIPEYILQHEVEWAEDPQGILEENLEPKLAEPRKIQDEEMYAVEDVSCEKTTKQNLFRLSDSCEFPFSGEVCRQILVVKRDLPELFKINNQKFPSSGVVRDVGFSVGTQNPKMYCSDNYKADRQKVAMPLNQSKVLNRNSVSEGLKNSVFIAEPFMSKSGDTSTFSLSGKCKVSPSKNLQNLISEPSKLAQNNCDRLGVSMSSFEPVSKLSSRPVSCEVGNLLGYCKKFLSSFCDGSRRPTISNELLQVLEKMARPKENSSSISGADLFSSSELTKCNKMLSEIDSVVPDALIMFFLQKAGIPSKDPRLLRAMSLCAQQYAFKVAEKTMEYWKKRYPESYNGEVQRRIVHEDDLVRALQQCRPIFKHLHRGGSEGEAKGAAEGEAQGTAEGEAQGTAEGEAQGAKTEAEKGTPPENLPGSAPASGE